MILVVGCGGLLGSNVASLASEETTVVGTYHTSDPELAVRTRQLDILDGSATEAVLDDVGPDVVVNCSAMTDVDACESDPDRAHAINGEAPGALAGACAARGIGFIHISTDYVFDGESTIPYPEGAATSPVQVYGASKLTGEQAVRNSHSKALILRLSFVFGIHQATATLAGFPARVRDRLRDGEKTSLFTDQWVTPTRAGQAANVIQTLAREDESGTYHVACRSCVTPHEFGQSIQRRMSVPNDLISKGSMADVERKAVRPVYTCLDVSRLEQTLGGPQPTLQEDLDAIEESLY